MFASHLSISTRGRRAVAIGAVGVAGVLVAAGCGTSSAHTSQVPPAASASGPGSFGAGAPATTSLAPPAPAGASSSTVAAVMVGRTGLGSILTDGAGLTVYLFEKDSGTTSSCNGACAALWPPVTTTTAQLAVAGGASRSLLGTTARTDGATQLTYAGHPLYRYAGDRKPGDTTGQGSQAFGGGWDVLTPAGQKVENGG
jgi:predicted lipoprotein with Yx(FWY)xxD motif